MDVHVVECYGGSQARQELGLDRWCPPAALQAVEAEPQRGIPAIARNETLCAEIEAALGQVPTTHGLLRGDSRKLEDLPDQSVHLVVTSPPYWTLKDYEPGDGQLGYVADYEEFNRALAQVWEHCYRLLVPGGRLVINVGDVLLPRRKVGRHLVYPLHATIIEHCRRIGFDNLTPVIWHKIANAKFEAGGGSILGKPYEPNGVIKSDIEWILFQRKPGGYRQPTSAVRAMSVIPQRRHQVWFQNIWTFGGASTRQHPAPYPLELPTRLIRMFSFVGDTVLDPFSGTATTTVAAASWGRDSIGVEVEPLYHEIAQRRVGEFACKEQLPLARTRAATDG
jgi:DNA modification methylase